MMLWFLYTETTIKHGYDFSRKPGVSEDVSEDNKIVSEYDEGSFKKTDDVNSDALYNIIDKINTIDKNIWVVIAFSIVTIVFVIYIFVFYICKKNLTNNEQIKSSQVDFTTEVAENIVTKSSAAEVAENIVTKSSAAPAINFKIYAKKINLRPIKNSDNMFNYSIEV